jgi:hypothetical protein
MVNTCSATAHMVSSQLIPTVIAHQTRNSPTPINCLAADILCPTLTLTSANTLVIQDHLMMMMEAAEVTEATTLTQKTSQHHPPS